MKHFFLYAAIILGLQTILTAAAIDPKSVVIIYNSRTAESKNLAEYYGQLRGIPKDNLVALDVADTDEISRADFKTGIQEPLRKTFTARKWWKLSLTPKGALMPSANKITTLVCMKGIPFKVKRSPADPGDRRKLPSHFAKANEASVDSELSLLGMHGIPLLGAQNNPYFKKDAPFAKTGLGYMFLVGRIDAPSYEICNRMIDDAIAIEKRGLWGMCYLDKALKGGGYAIGDEWMETIYNTNLKTGIPTVIDRNKQTYTTNYPMNDAALYFGWYTSAKNGPLLNPKFKFRRGSVAVHLHSTSASNLRNPNSNWTGPILAKGATATVGNVYEPYLQLTHYFDILHDRLLKGYSLVEAAYMSVPVLSWQNVVLGDPLYRPYFYLNGGGEKHDNDLDYRAIRIANDLWGNKPETLVNKLRTAAAEKSKPKLYEYLGLWHQAKKKNNVAIAFFNSAAKKHLRESDQLRQWIYVADIHRNSGQKPLAIQTLRQAQTEYGDIPEVKAATAILNILSPPPPPPASDAKKQSDAKKLKK